MVEITTVHEQVHDAVIAARERMKASADKKKRDPSTDFKVGAKVWLDLEGIHLNRFNLRPCPKLNPRYFGPFEIVEQPGPMRFRLDLPDDCYIHDVFHVNRLKLHTDPAMSKFKKKTIRLGKEFKDSNRKYEVEKILDHDVIRGKVWFLVHWRGFDEVTESTWESRERLMVDARDAVDLYEADHDIEVDGPTRKKKQKKSRH